MLKNSQAHDLVNGGHLDGGRLHQRGLEELQRERARLDLGDQVKAIAWTHFEAPDDTP